MGHAGPEGELGGGHLVAGASYVGGPGACRLTIQGKALLTKLGGASKLNNSCRKSLLRRSGQAIIYL